MGGAPFTFPSFFDNRTSQCTHTAPSDQEPPGDNPQQAGGTLRGGERQGASSTSVQPQNHAMGAAGWEPRGVRIHEGRQAAARAVHSLTEGREANISEINDSKSEFKIEHTGTAVFGCARPCVLTRRKEQSSDCICKHSVV